MVDPFAMPSWQRSLSTGLNRLLPPAVKTRLMHGIAASTAVPPEIAKQADPHLTARWMVSLYPERQYDGVVLGAPSGAAAHLSSLLGFPFFSQHVLTGIRGRFPVDDTAGYVRECAPVVQQILRRHADWSAIIHHDPLHDRFLVGDIGFVRLKYQRLPLAIREWIQRWVVPGGNILMLDCGYPWLQTPLPVVHESCQLQVGGLGDVSPEHYLSDDAALREYRLREGGAVSPWGLQDREADWRPESEWGTLPAYRDDAVDWAEQHGYAPIVLPFDHPDELTAWVLQGFRQLWPESSRVYLDCFTHSCPTFNRRAQALPLWLPFLGKDSLRLATQLLQAAPALKDVLISLHPSFANPLDLATIADWETLLGDRQVTWLGVDRGTYPTDLGAYGRYLPALTEYLKSRSSERTWDGSTLSVEEFLRVTQQTDVSR